MSAPEGKFRGHVLMMGIRYNACTHDAVHDALEQACFELTQNGYLVTPGKQRGTADVEDNRNTALTLFHVRKDFTHMVMYDQDVSWEPGTIIRLIMHPVDLVVGVYPKRAEGQGWPLKTFPEPMQCMNPQSGKPHPNGLIKIAGGPGGLMRFNRSAIDKLIEHRRDHWYASKLIPGGKCWSLFEFDVIDHERVSEDMNFCRMWRDMGEDVWCDPHLMLHHHGDKAYSGQVIDHLKQIGRVIDPAKMAKVSLDAGSL
jgi:hypothetical protein